MIFLFRFQNNPYFDLILSQPHGFVLVSPTTTYQRHGTLQIINHSEIRPMGVWLLNDKLIYGKSSKDHSIKYKGEIWLEKLEAKPTLQNGKYFVLELTPSIGEKVYLGTETPEERDAWIEDIKKVATNFKAKGDDYARVKATFALPGNDKKRVTKGLQHDSLERLRQNSYEQTISSLRYQNQQLSNQAEELLKQVELLKKENLELRGVNDFTKSHEKTKIPQQEVFFALQEPAAEEQ